MDLSTEPGYFITGTDTGVGKTLAAAAVLARLRESGLDAVPCKAVQTGCTADEPNPDLDLCLRLNGLTAEPEMAPYRFALPASPHLAAAREGRRIDLDTLVATIRRLRGRHDAVVVEGAGGVLVPLDDEATMLDLMVALALPVLLVARPGLGTLNHTLLSVAQLRGAGLTVAGILFSDADGAPWGEIEQDNLATLAARTRVPFVSVLPHLPDGLSPAEFRERTAEALAPLRPEPPGSASAAVLWRRDQASLWHPFTRHSAQRGEPFPIIVRGAGCHLLDAHGRRWLDAISSWWAVNLGHSHPRLVSAIAQQAGRLQHSILGNLSHAPAIELAHRLVELFPDPRRRVFYASDGACANEAALRLAVQHQHNLGRPDKHGFVAFREGYHGDTLGAVSVGFLDSFHEAYRPLLFPVAQAEPPLCAGSPLTAAWHSDDFAPYERMIESQAHLLAAVIVEPLCQGAAGMRMYPPGFLSDLADCCARHDVLLIVDEIAMGYGRTGRMFAFEHAGIDPDIVTLGKGLSGGCLPMSAAVVKERIFASFDDTRVDHTFYYGHTFAGNPLAAAAALACLDVYEEQGIVAQAAAMGESLAACLAPLAERPGVSNVRSLGLVGAFDLPSAAAAQSVRRKLLEQGVLLRPLGTTVYVAPPLVIGEELLRELVETVAGAL